MFIIFLHIKIEFLIDYYTDFINTINIKQNFLEIPFQLDKLKLISKLF